MHRDQDPYWPIKATVENIIAESPTIKTFVVRPEKAIPFRTGQFMEITLPGIGEAPFTPSSSPRVSDVFDFTIMEAGKVTNLLHTLEAGAVVGVRGPYGKCYPVEKFAKKDILILGGGVGLAPLRSLLYELFSTPEKYGRVIICYGAKSPADVIYKEQLPEWRKMPKVEVHQSVDTPAEGWPHTVGVVTVLLDKIKVDPKNAVAIVCGPPVMMKFGTLRLLELGYSEQDIYLSMEKNMSCGVGKCGHCRLDHFYVCKDGPVFTYAEIKGIEKIWD